jgi:hypothetical protein
MDERNKFPAMFVVMPGRGLIPPCTAEELHVYLAHGIAVGNFLFPTFKPPQRLEIHYV